MIVLLVIFLLVGSVHSACFKDKANQSTTWEWSTSIGAKHQGIDSSENCLDLCLDSYTCVATNYKIEERACYLFNFMVKEETCLTPCKSMMIDLPVPESCQHIKNTVNPYHERFLSQTCLPILDLCKTTMKLKERIQETEETQGLLTKHLDQTNQELSELDKHIDLLKAYGIQMKEQNSKFQMEISQRNKLLDQTMTPLGAIVAWLPGYSKTNHIPEGWQRCDGSRIMIGPFTGRRTPDLNQRFLRGGSDGQAFQFQEDAIQDHTHRDSGHSHKDSGHSHTDSGHRHEFKDQGTWRGQMYGVGPDSDGWDLQTQSSGGFHRKWVYRTDTSKARISTNYANIRTSKSGISGIENGKKADETRPKSMFVVYIIRIF